MPCDAPPIGTEMGSKKINWKRGLFRIWVVATCVWLPVGIYPLGDNFTAVKTVEHVPPGVNPYECIINRAPCPQWQFTLNPTGMAGARHLSPCSRPRLLYRCSASYFSGRHGLLRRSLNGSFKASGRARLKATRTRSTQTRCASVRLPSVRRFAFPLHASSGAPSLPSISSTSRSQNQR